MVVPEITLGGRKTGLITLLDFLSRTDIKILGESNDEWHEREGGRWFIAFYDILECLL